MHTVDEALIRSLGRSPQNPSMLRLQHAQATVELSAPADIVFRAFSQWTRYDEWAPPVQGPAHWLVKRKGGPGSSFVLYDNRAGVIWLTLGLRPRWTRIAGSRDGPHLASGSEHLLEPFWN